MRKVKCEICGKVFETDKRNVKYCSLECRAAGAANRRQLWESRKPGYNARYYREHHPQTISEPADAPNQGDLKPDV